VSGLPVRVLAALAVAVAVTSAGYAVADTPPGPTPALGPEPVTIVLDVHHSRFTPEALRVVAGTTVRFVVVNRDPINHELIVGPAEVHDRHRTGTEPFHEPVPGEVSVGPLERAVTSYTFDAPGTVVFACHLPRHFEYGMHGVVEVVAPQP
jgi:uncharacterized cupredoxin-like copper-binding protein